MNITMRVEAVISLLSTHRSEHVAEYKLQMEGWKEKMEAYTNACTEWAANGGTGDRPHMTNKPVDFTADYDKLLAQASCHVHPTLEIDEHDFDMIVCNNFGWKNTFTANTQLYSNGR